MARRSWQQLARPFVLLIMLCIGGALVPQAAAELAAAAAWPITGPATRLIPDQLTLSGDVSTRANTSGRCTAPWLAGTPAGTIMLGVNPASCDPVNWKGGTATAQIHLADHQPPALILLTLSWPDHDGKGIHSPDRRRTAHLTLDGHPLWDKLTLERSTYDDYYAAQHSPIQTTIVLTDTAVHTLQFSVPPHTAWDISSIELTITPSPTTIHGIGYSPYRDCQGPGTKLQPSTQDIQEDLYRLVHTTNAIRTYAATGVNGQVPALANAIGLPIYAGAWLDYPDEPQKDDAEIQALINLANTTHLDGAIVGNEFYLRHRTPLALSYLLGRIRQVRAGLNDKHLPLMSAEIDNLMFRWAANDSATILGINPNYRSILDEVDIVMVHIYPFWNKLPIDGAAELAVARYNAMRNLIAQTYPGKHKRVIIGETGWPSGGGANGRAVPGLEQQRLYLTQFLVLAEQYNVDFMYFDAFDELWKIEEPKLVGQHWGYAYSDRSANHAFYGVLIPADALMRWRVWLPLMQSSTESAPEPAFSAHIFQSAPLTPAANSPTLPIYTEWLIDHSHFVPSGYMGDIDKIDMYECDRTFPHSGEMAIRATFTPGGELGWSGVSWQDPRSNWGQLPGGYDLRGARRLTFWARGAAGGEVVEFQVGGVGSDTAPYRDSIRPARTTGPIRLSDHWEQIAIDLTGADLSRVVGSFAWVANSCHNNQPITFYLDDIQIDYNAAPPATATTPRQLFYVYGDHNAGCTHFAPSGFMGDISDVTLNPAWNNAPHRGRTAIKVDYAASGSQGWAGVYWQEPENNWGTITGGYDLSWANKLSFWARGERGGERIEFFMGGIGAGNAPYPDSQRPAASLGFVQLEPGWHQYTIDLRGHDLSHVIGGFGFSTSRCANPAGATFYLDDIIYEYDPAMPPPPAPGSTFPVYTDAGAPGNHYVPSLWMGDGATPSHVSLTECATDAPASGQTNIRVSYTPGAQGWAGVYWVHPFGNTGDLPGGYDLTGADRLVFYARGTPSGTPVTFLIGGVGYQADNQGRSICLSPPPRYADTLCPTIHYPVALSPNWTRYEINLVPYQNRDWHRVVGGFGWTANQAVTFEVDDIVYEFDP